MAVEVRRGTAADAPACQAIVRGLPEYFTDDVADTVAHDLEAHGGWVVEGRDGADLVGFAIVERRSRRAAEVLWAAVRSERRNGGVGSSLLQRVLADLAADGVAVVEAKTLDAASGYEPYIATRAFWERHGFVQVDTIDPLPGWETGNPSAIYICALGPTRDGR